MNIDEALKEIAEYKKIDFKEIKESYKEISEKFSGYVKFSNLSADEWNQLQINQENIQNVMEFYKNTPNYIFELMETHSTQAKSNLSNIVIDYCIKNNFKSILDFGAGVCQDSIIASKNNLDSTAADIPGKTFNFGKWRIEKYNLKIKTIDIFDENPLKENYDAITCFEVLQHVVNPDKTLSHLIEHLNLNGMLFITARFKNNYSLALKRNEHLDETFDEMIKKSNLIIKEKIHIWGKGDSSKFLYLLMHSV